MSRAADYGKRAAIKPGWVGDGFHELDDRIEYFVKFAFRQNFGDYLPELICKELLTYPRFDADLYRLIGSVIDEEWIQEDLRRANGHIGGTVAFWGCGARRAARIDPEILARCRFFGVRGALTRDLLGLPADTVLGDPGLLAPLFHRPRPHSATAGRAICLPHIHDPKPEPEILALSGADMLVHPEVAASEPALREILDKIASADFVLTASLHGAIVACAYRRPFAFWDNGHVDSPFKWQDFASSVGMPARFVKSVAEGREVYAAELAPAIRMPPLAAILDMCPFAPRPSALLAALDLDAEGCATFDAADRLAALPSSAADHVLRMQADAAARRAERASLRFVLRRKAGLGWRRGKDRLRAIRDAVRGAGA